jgi:hypothetical protein
MTATYELVTHPDGWRTVEPKPSVEALKAFYAGEYFQRSHGTYAPDYDATERAHRDLLARQLLYAVEAARGADGGRLLDVGCGEGWLLAAATPCSGWISPTTGCGVSTPSCWPRPSSATPSKRWTP